MFSRKLFTSAVILLLALTSFAKDKDSKKGHITFATSLGYNSYTNVDALPGNLVSYKTAAKSMSWANQKLSLGFELGWFAGHNWKLSIEGGAHFNYNPAHSALPGTMDAGATEEENWGEIPAYEAVASEQKFSYRAVLGIDRYFKTRAKNLSCFVGLRAGGAYTQAGLNSNDSMAMGISLSETWNVVAAVAVGADYHISDAFYLGAQIHPVSYTYSVITHKPQEGLAALSANSHNIGCFAAPTLKVGFMF